LQTYLLGARPANLERSMKNMVVNRDIPTEFETGELRVF
jgi:hypothetical protein